MISMVTMKAMPTPDQTAYTTPTSNPLTLRANESKVRLSAEKTTVASAGMRFENPCESFKEMAAASSKKSANMRKTTFIRDLLFLRQCLLYRRWFCRLHSFSHAKALLKDCRVLRRHPGPSSCCCGVRPLVHRQEIIELPGGHRLSEQGANPQRPGDIVDEVERLAPARHHRQHLSGGSHPARAGHRRVVPLRAASDGGELDHRLLFPQAERPRRRGLIGCGMRIIGGEHDNVTQPARLELIGGGVEESELLRVIELDPYEVGQETANWTTQLLATYLSEQTGISVSLETVRVYLHAHGYVCKRPTWTLKRKAEEKVDYVGNARLGRGSVSRCRSTRTSTRQRAGRGRSVGSASRRPC
jgi:Winged helix-turn helix